MNTISPAIVLSVALCLSASACALSASGSASATLETGHFFGHDLRRARSVVYVIDLSGSMAEESGSILERKGTELGAAAAGGVVGAYLGSGAGDATRDRIESLQKKVERVKMHLIASLQGLPTGARFNVITFSDGVQRLAPGLVHASPATVGLVSGFVSQLEEGGSTNMYAAMEAALFGGAEHIIVLTDGQPTSTSSEAVLDLVRRFDQGQVRVSTVGVGGDQAREFLATLAAEHRGTYTQYD